MIENAYFQFFCGETYFQTKLPLDRTSMSVWRARIGADKLELLLSERWLPRRAPRRSINPRWGASRLLLRVVEWLNKLHRVAPALSAAGDAGPPQVG